MARKTRRQESIQTTRKVARLVLFTLIEYEINLYKKKNLELERMKLKAFLVLEDVNLCEGN